MPKNEAVVRLRQVNPPYDVLIFNLGGGRPRCGRLERALSNFEVEQVSYRCRLVDAQRRLASYQPRVGEGFAFTAELDLKREQLVDIEKDLAAADRFQEPADSAVG